MPLLDVRGLTVRFRTEAGINHAVDGVSFRIEEGEIFSLLGPNGAGKTTTIRLLTGLAHPSGGKAWVAGEELSGSRKVTRRIGYLPEEPAFYPWMTAREYLRDFIAPLYGLEPGAAARRSAEIRSTTSPPR